MTRNRTLLRTIWVENPPCDVHVRAHKDEGEGALREKILVLSSQFVRAVGEKLFSEKLFSKKLCSKLGCLREAVLEKPSSENCSMCPNREVVLTEVVLQEEVLRPPTLKVLFSLSPHVLRTKSRRLGPTGDQQS